MSSLTTAARRNSDEFEMVPSPVESKDNERRAAAVNQASSSPLAQTAGDAFKDIRSTIGRYWTQYKNDPTAQSIAFAVAATFVLLNGLEYVALSVIVFGAIKYWPEQYNSIQQKVQELIKKFTLDKQPAPLQFVAGAFAFVAINSLISVPAMAAIGLGVAFNHMPKPQPAAQ